MMVHFELLRHAAEVHETLRNNGWRIDSIHRNSVSASHPEARDQATARGRLHKMGLLTSRCVRISFGHFGRID
jgi:hypothetical protein